MRFSMGAIVIGYALAIMMLIPIIYVMATTDQLTVTFETDYLNEYNECANESNLLKDKLKERNICTCHCPDSTTSSAWYMTIGFIFGVIAMGYYLIVIHGWFKKKIQERKDKKKS